MKTKKIISTVISFSLLIQICGCQNQSNESVDQTIFSYSGNGNASNSAISESNESTTSSSIVTTTLINESEDVMQYKRRTIIRHYNDGSSFVLSEEEYDSYGNKIKFISYDSDGNIKEWKKCQYEYNTMGQKTKLTQFNEDDSIKEWREFQYNELNNIVEIAVYNSSGNIVEKTKKDYDLTGNLLKEVHTKNSEIDLWEEYEYDMHGNKNRYYNFDSNRNVINWEEYTYDTKDNLILFIDHYPDDSIKQKKEYDSYGNITKSISYKKDGSVKEWTEYYYNSLNQETKYTSYYADGIVPGDGEIIWHFEIEYDSDGNMIKTSKYDESYNLLGWCEHTYDDLGNETSYFWYEPDGSISLIASEVYEYDSDGNRIRHIKYDENMNIMSIIESEYDEFGNVIKTASCEPDGSVSIWDEIIYEY